MAANHRWSCHQNKNLDIYWKGASIERITLHFHHPLKINTIYLICSQQGIVGGSHNMLSREVWLQVYFNMMVIISIFAHKSVSTDIFHKIHFTNTKYPPCLAYFVLSTFGKAWWKVSWHFLFNMYFTGMKWLDGNLVTVFRLWRKTQV